MLLSQVLLNLGFAFAFGFIIFMFYVGFKMKLLHRKGVSDFTPTEIGYLSIRFFPGLAFFVAIMLFGSLLQKWGY